MAKGLPGKTWRTTFVSDFSSKLSRDDDSACLVCIYPPGPDLCRRWILSGDVTIGRGSACDIQLDRDSISREHARLSKSDAEWSITDLASTNGTYLNREPVEIASLKDGDTIQTGAVIFKFFCDDSVEAAYFEEIHRASIYDNLTDVFNRRHFESLLNSEAIRAERFLHSLSLVMFDVDHLGAINDDVGHIAGDQYLSFLAKSIKAALRPVDAMARWSGDVFAVVLPETEQGAACTVAESIREKVASMCFSHEGAEVNTTVSVGVSTFNPTDPTDIENLLEAARSAVSEAKRSGRDCVRWHAPQGGVAQVTFRPPLPMGMFMQRLASVPHVLVGVRFVQAFGRGSVPAVSTRGQRRLFRDRFIEELSRGVEPTSNLSVGDYDETISLVASSEMAKSELESVVRRAIAEVREKLVGESFQFLVGPVRYSVEDDAVERAIADLAMVSPAGVLPMPLAQRVRAIESSIEPLERAFAVVELFETYVRWLVGVVCADIRAGLQAKELPSVLAEPLLSGKPISLGAWTEVLRAAFRARRAGGGHLEAVGRSVDAFWNARRNKPLAAFQLLVDFVPCRNALAHGRAGAGLIEEIGEKWGRELTSIIESAASAFAGVQPFFIEEIDFVPDGLGFQYRGRLLVGSDPVVMPMQLTSEQRLRKEHLYLVDQVRDEAILLDPMISYMLCGVCEGREVFYADACVDRRLTLRAAASTHVMEVEGEWLSGR